MYKSVKSDFVAEAVVRTLDELHFALKPGSKVFIKIDVPTAERPGVSPDVLQTVIKTCLVNQASEVKVGDAAPESAAEKSGILKVVADSGTSYVDLSKDKRRNVKALSAVHWRMGIKIPESLAAADAIILISKVSADPTYRFTGALTSGIGLVPGLGLFGNKIAKTVEIQTAFNPVIAINDLTSFKLGELDFHPSTIVAGSRVDTDIETARILNTYSAKLGEPRDIPIIAYALKINLDQGTTDLGLVEENYRV